jgi:hypothetical protein
MDKGKSEVKLIDWKAIGDAINSQLENLKYEHYDIENAQIGYIEINFRFVGNKAGETDVQAHGSGIIAQDGKIRVNDVRFLPC